MVQRRWPEFGNAPLPIPNFDAEVARLAGRLVYRVQNVPRMNLFVGL